MQFLKGPHWEGGVQANTKRGSRKPDDLSFQVSFELKKNVWRSFYVVAIYVWWCFNMELSEKYALSGNCSLIAGIKEITRNLRGLLKQWKRIFESEVF